MLIGGTIAWFLILPGFAVVAISIVERVICLTKSEAEFDKTNISGSKYWL